MNILRIILIPVTCPWHRHSIRGGFSCEKIKINHAICSLKRKVGNCSQPVSNICHKVATIDLSWKINSEINLGFVIKKQIWISKELCMTDRHWAEVIYGLLFCGPEENSWKHLFFGLKPGLGISKPIEKVEKVRLHCSIWNSSRNLSSFNFSTP